MGFKSPFVALKEGIAKTLAGDYDKKAVKEAIGQYTEESKVVVFSWTRYRTNYNLKHSKRTSA